MTRNLGVKVILILFSMIFIRAEASSARSLYDDFTGTHINNQKWYNREFVREVVAGRLVSKIGNASGTGTFRNMTEFQDPASIDTIACDITVVETDLDTGIYPRSFARIEGFFYNTKGTGGAKGDIWAAVVIGDRGDGLEAWLEVQEFLDDDMTSWDTTTRMLIGPGAIAYNAAYPTKIAYDGARGFEFTVGTWNGSFTGPRRKRPAVTQIKTLTTGINAESGSGTGYVSALFDDVYINNETEVYDDFATAPLDPTRWPDLESVTEISDGKVRLNVQADGSETSAILYATDQTSSYLEARVTVESGSSVSPGATGAARVGGYYYNESRGSGSGQDYNQYEGNVWGDVRIELDNDNNLKARAIVVRSDDANESTWTFRFDQDFTTSIAFDTAYALSIEFTGSGFIFKCGDESVDYQVSTDTYEPYGKSRTLSSKLYAKSGQEGYVKAGFDEVYTAVGATGTTDSTISGDGCFIATAAYGSPIEPHVKVLRDLRDRFLLANSVGNASVRPYSMTAPPIADYTAEHESLRTATRWSLTPGVYGIEHPKAILLIVFGLGIGMVVAGSRKSGKK